MVHKLQQIGNYWFSQPSDGLTKRGSGGRKVRGPLFSVLKKVAVAISSV